MMPSNGSRRMSTGTGIQSVGGRLTGQSQPSHYGYSQHTGSGRIMPRSGSDQHLPRVDYTSITTPARHTLLRSSLKTGWSEVNFLLFLFNKKLGREVKIKLPLPPPTFLLHYPHRTFLNLNVFLSLIT